MRSRSPGGTRKRFTLLLVVPFLSAACQTDPPPDDSPDSGGCSLSVTSTAGNGTIMTRANILQTGHLLAPGGSVSLSCFAADLQDVTQVEMGLYNFVTYPSGAIDIYGSPDFYSMQLTSWASSAPRLDSISVQLNSTFSGAPPSPAFIRVTYRDSSNQERQVSIGEYDRLAGEAPDFVFEPNYVEYFGAVDIPIGADLFGHTVEDTVFPDLTGPGLAKFEENYFRVSRVSLKQPADFGGTSWLTNPCAQSRWLRQGYHVTAPPHQSGTFQMFYVIVTPSGLLPPEMNQLDAYELRGDFPGIPSQGLPNISSVEFHDHTSSLPASLPGSCN